MKVHETIRIGVLVNEIKHNIANEDIVQLAKSLLTKWKKISKQPQSMRSTAPSQKSIQSEFVSSSSKQSSTTQPAAVIPTKSLHDTADPTECKLVRESSADDDDYLEKLPEARRKMYDKLKAVYVDADGSTNRMVANALALAIESAVDEVCPFVKDNKAYLLKCRDLAFNLSKNNVCIMRTEY